MPHTAGTENANHMPPEYKILNCSYTNTIKLFSLIYARSARGFLFKKGIYVTSFDKQYFKLSRNILIQ